MQYSANLSLVGYSMYSSSICNTTNFNCTAYYIPENKIAHTIGVTFGYCILHTYRTMLGALLGYTHMTLMYVTRFACLPDEVSQCMIIM